MNKWLQEFFSLTWYEILLRFIATFIAKTSELLLAAGLVVSSANFLTDGDVLGTASFASKAWAWTQALAIDSSLAISFYNSLQCLKQRDWTKFVLYSLLTLLLALVAGTITNIDIYSHAIHATIGAAMNQIGINVEVLSTLRAIAVVGFVLMSRLRDVSFKDLYSPDETTLPQERAVDTHPTTSNNGEVNRLTVEEVAMLAHAFSQRGTTVKEVSEEVETGQSGVGEKKKVSDTQHSPHQPIAQISLRTETVPQQPTLAPSLDEQQVPSTGTSPMQTKKEVPEELQSTTSTIQHQNDEPIQATGSFRDARTSKRANALSSSVTRQDEPSQEQEARLEQAYQELNAEGKKPSGRALAERAHIHRSTCNAWLRANKSFTNQSVTNADAGRQEPES